MTAALKVNEAQGRMAKAIQRKGISFLQVIIMTI
jgi:hypothetical protein